MSSNARIRALHRAWRPTMIGLLLFAVGGVFWAPTAAANDLRIGKPAPPLTLHTLNGHDIALKDLRGKVVIVTFWATWCSICHKELPLLSRYAKQHEGEGLRVLAFSLDDSGNLKAVHKMADRLDFPVGLLGSQWAGGYGRIWHLPVSFVIGRSGQLLEDGWKEAHPAWTLKKLNEEVTPLLEQSTKSANSGGTANGGHS